MRWFLCLFFCVLGQGTEASSYGCKGLANLRQAPSVEGKDGVFFRIQSDLKMDHGFSTQAIENLAGLSAALAQGGTHLIYLPVPAKSLAMPNALPDASGLFGFEPEIATWVMADLTARLEKAGVATVNAAPEMARSPKSKPPFHKTDFHWTAWGAETAARLVAQRMSQFATYQDMKKSRYHTQSTGHDVARSNLRRLLQQHCQETLPSVTSEQFETQLLANEDSVLDIFGTSDISPQIVLVGTSFSARQGSNFSGFLSQHSGLEVTNRALSGGNQFGSIQDYLTSDAFLNARPKFLIWENPIYNRLTHQGSQVFAGLRAAALDDCRLLESRMVEGVAKVVLPEAYEQDVLLIEARSDVLRKAQVTFTSIKGDGRSRVVKRTKRQHGTNRIFVAMSGLWKANPVSASVNVGQAPESDLIFKLCNSKTRSPS
ncbi:MAG: alginate O-acetyltransferase AlgX-related protein [Cognatishimia sp.]|uniref:alginate O-acetyltransferase AlgX-related protein n=1 Tax=Cognatishimia sp. TaxID=2211648 RepID=UPI0040591DDC